MKWRTFFHFQTLLKHNKWDCPIMEAVDQKWKGKKLEIKWWPMHSVLFAIYFIDEGPGPSLIFHNNTVAIYACSVCTMLCPSPGFAYVRVHSSHQIWFCAFSSIGSLNHRGGKGRGETSRMSLPSQLARIPQLGPEAVRHEREISNAGR